MNRPIQVGDLVVLVRGHGCILERHVGRVFTVLGLVAPVGGGWHCTWCHKDSAGPNEIAARINEKPGGIPLSWLKRIPPLSELEGEQSKEELHA